MSLKRKRTQLTINNKLDIIKYYEENMRLKKQEIADYFNLKWRVDINRRQFLTSLIMLRNGKIMRLIRVEKE